MKPFHRAIAVVGAMAAASAATLSLVPGPASATLTLLQPTADPSTFAGTGGYSADGLGQAGPGGTVQAEVPVASTVVRAYLYGTYVGSAPDVTERTIDFDGTVVETAQIATSDNMSLSTTRAEVTTQVATKVGAGGGVTDFVVNSDPTSLDGVALVVLYSNPTLPYTTVAVLDGSASPFGDSAEFNFAAPLDKTTADFSATMSLGSGFSYQGGAPGPECGADVAQSSLVDVNGTRLTSCAGNWDDGIGENGALITVGGVGDSTNNPADPLQQPADGNPVRVEDDEFYNIEPLLAQGALSATITSSNPSTDDNLFLAIIAITARATVSQENCTNGLDDDGDGFIDGADPDCVVAPPNPEICNDSIDNDGDGLIDALDPECVAADTRRMTGGGSIKVSKTSKVSYGATLRCDTSTPGLSQRLQVNWGKGQKFHLTEIAEPTCSNSATISEGKPFAGFDTYSGSGTGRYKGVDGATAEWTLTDAGEPGKRDTFRIKVTTAGGNVVLNATGKLSAGNNQAHR